MRARRLAFTALASVLGASPAPAAILTSATWVTEWGGVYGTQVSFTVPVTASGASNATSISVNLAVPGFSGSMPLAGVPLQSPSATLTLSGMQLIAATAGMASATTGIPGNQLTRVPLGTLVKIPLNVGVQGSFSTSSAVFFPNIIHSINAVFYAWTPGTLTLTGLTSNLAPLPDVTAMGSFNLTANGAGTVMLVSPTKITDRSSLPYGTKVSLTTLTLHFVPEPGAPLLLGAAVVALTISRRCRIRGRRHADPRSDPARS